MSCIPSRHKTLHFIHCHTKEQFVLCLNALVKNHDQGGPKNGNRIRLENRQFLAIYRIPFVTKWHDILKKSACPRKVSDLQMT